MTGLGYILKVRGIEHQGIAKILGVSKTSLSLWTTGERDIPLKHLSQIAELGINLEYATINNITNDDKIKMLEEEIGRLKSIR